MIPAKRATADYSFPIYKTESFLYAPYGDIISEYNTHVMGEAFPKYSFNAKELDEETGMYYYEARYYAPPTFTSRDPLFEKYFWMSPYAYCANNPVKYVDPSGENVWKPDNEGNLIAEKSDNAWTLAKYLQITPKEAISKLKSQGYTVNNGILNLKVGDKFIVDNVYTQSISNSDSKLTVEAVLAGTASMSDFQSVDDYNCWGSAIAGSQGKDIVVGIGIKKGSDFDKQIENHYIATDLANAKFGKTLIRFADNNNTVLHGAIYYGTSKDGTVYVYTKNGWYLKPTVMKLNDLLKNFNYGTVQGLKKGDSGFYDFNK